MRVGPDDWILRVETDSILMCIGDKKKQDREANVCPAIIQPETRGEKMEL
jgi:hypothetical protein